MKTTLSAVKKNFLLLSMASLLISLAPQAAYAFSAAAQQIQGEVLVHKTADAADSWTAVTQDTVLASGDSIKTRKGTCSLVYSDQATFKMEENTSVTVEETPVAQDLKLLLGNIKGKVNHEKVTLPFEIVTPAAVATVRGTEVDFGFNEEGLLTVDLHNGKIQVINDNANLTLDLDGKKSITVQFDKEANILRVKNGCGSDGPVKFNMLGTEYSENPCEEKEVSLATAENVNTKVDTNSDSNDVENPENLRPPSTQI